MKQIILLVLIQFSFINQIYSQDTIPLSKDQLKIVYTEYQKTADKLFSKNGTISDANKLYDTFYTDDFEYNHPAYGGVYSRKLLFNNTINYLKKGGYNNSPKRTLINIIIGLNAIVVEQKYENDDETTMTLFKFRGDKIYYIEEYW